jgi:hypothetical protein
VDEELALYVPESAHGLPLDLHSADWALLTQRSLLPVSICNLNDCAGVPSVPFAKYNVPCKTVRKGEKHTERPIYLIVQRNCHFSGPSSQFISCHRVQYCLSLDR